MKKRSNLAALATLFGLMAPPTGKRYVHKWKPVGRSPKRFATYERRARAKGPRCDPDGCGHVHALGTHCGQKREGSPPRPCMCKGTPPATFAPSPELQRRFERDGEIERIDIARIGAAGDE